MKLPATLFLFVLALSLRAETLLCPYSADRPCEIATGTDADGAPRTWPFQVIRASADRTVLVKAESSDVSVVRLKSGSSGTSSAVVPLSRETSRSAGEDTASFDLIAVRPGDATITVSIAGDGASVLQFPVVVTGEDIASRITLSPSFLRIDEGTTTNVVVMLGSAPVEGKQLRIWWTEDVVSVHGIVSVHVYNGGDYYLENYVTIPAGQTQASFLVTGLVDENNFEISVYDPDGEYRSASLTGFVANKPPTVSASTDPDNPTPWGDMVFAGKPAAFTVSAVGARDGSDTLTYRWSFAPDDPSSDPDKTWTNAWSEPSGERSSETVFCDVSDGTENVRSYFSVIVRPAETAPQRPLSLFSDGAPELRWKTSGDVPWVLRSTNSWDWYQNRF